MTPHLLRPYASSVRFCVAMPFTNAPLTAIELLTVLCACAYIDSWPRSLDDSNARKEWQWRPEYDLDGMTKDILHHVRIKLQKKH